MLIIFYILSQHRDYLVDIYFEKEPKDEWVFKIVFERNKRYSDRANAIVGVYTTFSSAGKHSFRFYIVYDSWWFIDEVLKIH